MDPVPTEITFEPYGGFMFALAISVERASGMLDMSGQDIRYFDVELTHWQKQPDYSYVPSPLPLASCTTDHFAQNPKIVKQLPPGIINKMVCPAFNSTVTLQGARITSNTSYITLNIKKCNSTLYTNCISDGELQQLQATSGGKFQALLMLMSNTISPESQEYHHPYIDSRRMFSFTLNNGLEADIYIQESVVQTDHSLTPVPDIQE